MCCIDGQENKYSVLLQTFFFLISSYTDVASEGRNFNLPPLAVQSVVVVQGWPALSGVHRVPLGPSLPAFSTCTGPPAGPGCPRLGRSGARWWLEGRPEVGCDILKFVGPLLVVI
jgi:hypothetical protein